MKKGFTLVEVFAMLAIIGVISVITILSVLKKTSQSSLIEQAKKTAATLNQAIYNAVITSGEVNTWSWQSENGMENILKSDIGPRLNTGHECTGPTDELCYYAIKKINGTYDYFDNFSPNARVILNDGAVISFGENYALGDEFPSCRWAGDPYTLCTIIMVDVNGNKKPNAIGRDVFFYGLQLNGSVLPYGATKSAKEIDAGCSNISEGYTCAAKLVKDGWEACTDPNCVNPYPFAF